MELVQQIAVTKSGQHSDVVAAVACASAKMMVEHYTHPSVQRWLRGSFTKTVRRGSEAKVESLIEEIQPNAVASIAKYPRVADDGSGPSAVKAVAFLPMTRDEVPRPLAKLRVADFERPRDDMWHRDGAGPMLFINGGIEMSTGKTAAQVAHGLCAWLLDRTEREWIAWLEAGCPFSTDELIEPEFIRAKTRASAIIRDAGLTEVEPGTATVLVR